jgi:tubulin-specific chaperone A
MPAPSQLAIATQSVQRLIKEEAYYHKELAGEKARVEKIEGDVKAGNSEHGDNADFVLKQEVRLRGRPLTIFTALHNWA